MSTDKQQKPVFTVEQVELIRRLRNSGLTKDQLVEAFESLEQVEAELGNTYTIPATLAQHSSWLASLSQASQMRSSENQRYPMSLPTTSHHSQFPMFPQNNSSSNLTQATGLFTNGQSHSTLPGAPDQGQTAVHVNRRFPLLKRHKVVKAEEEGAEEGEEGTSQQDDKSNTSSPSEGSFDDVEEFLKKGTERMHEEIREFLFAFPACSHTDVAASAGVEVVSVSKFLIGNFSAIPAPALNQLCQWFLTARFKLFEKQQQQPQQQQLLQQQQSLMLTSKLMKGFLGDNSNSNVALFGAGNSSNPDTSMGLKQGDYSYCGPGLSGQEGIAVNFQPRRERFTFRSQHLEVLEAFFKTNQYPSFEERCDIAKRCNDVMEYSMGQTLGEKEWMIPQNVAYWFSNRRKDIKRKARQGGIELSSVVLPSKVKRMSFPSVDKDALQDLANLHAAYPHLSNLNFSASSQLSTGDVSFPSRTTVPLAQDQESSRLETSVPETSTMNSTAPGLPALGSIAFPFMEHASVANTSSAYFDNNSSQVLKSPSVDNGDTVVKSPSDGSDTVLKHLLDSGGDAMGGKQTSDGNVEVVVKLEPTDPDEDAAAETNGVPCSW